ncbi:MAG: tRNA pseudouridine(55) synthase TruB [Firmicutes bacterium]|nr:tRNA pseudouridine(55) synthase TruB [Bacillota bacterium]
MNGIINLLKPPGMTSHDVVAVIRRLTNVKRTGHTGTLDPGAAGVLPICVGQATRVAEYVLAMDKSYRAELTLGSATDTEDGSGKIVAERAVPAMTVVHIQTVLTQFLGKRMQTPPMYSAVRIDGEKLYERARRGETVERPARPIDIYQIELIRIGENTILFDVTCSRGTYIRTLCCEIAQALGTVGHMSYLIRTHVGPFQLEDALSLEECASRQAAGELENAMLSVDAALINLPMLSVSAEDAVRVINGIAVPLPTIVAEGTLVRVYGPKQEFLAVSLVEQGRVQPRKVFHSR